MVEMGCSAAQLRGRALCRARHGDIRERAGCSPQGKRGQAGSSCAVATPGVPLLRRAATVDLNELLRILERSPPYGCRVVPTPGGRTASGGSFIVVLLREHLPDARVLVSPCLLGRVGTPTLVSSSTRDDQRGDTLRCEPEGACSASPPA